MRSITIVPLVAVLMLLCPVTRAVEGQAVQAIWAVPFTDVKITGGFWAPRLRTNREVTLWADFRKCEETGRVDNFVKAAGKMPGPFKGIRFDDSDIYKVIEGAAYTL